MLLLAQSPRGLIRQLSSLCRNGGILFLDLIIQIRLSKLRILAKHTSTRERYRPVREQCSGEQK